jgi:hypothetical protein
MGAALYEGNHLELASLALLACDVSSDDPDRALLTEIERMLARSAELAQSDPEDQRLTASVRMIFAALSIARTPRAPMPA